VTLLRVFSYGEQRRWIAVALLNVVIHPG